MRVLVVEDEPLIRLLAVDILEAAGFAVTDASSVAAALLAAGDERFDAAVIDLGLPDAPCATLIRALLLLQPGLGIVVSTGRQRDDPQVAEACRTGGDGIAAILSKPWAEDALLSAVQAAVALTRRARDGTTRGPATCHDLRTS